MDFVEMAEESSWYTRAKDWAAAGPGKFWAAFQESFPTLYKFYPELTAYVEESVVKVKDADAKFFALKVL